MRIPDLLLNVRDTLADPGKQRWSDERLIRLINEAQKALARRFDLLRGEVSIPIEINKAIYKLPEDCWLVTRAEYDGVKLNMYSYNEMDNKDPAWQSDTGNKIEAIVFDHRNVQEIRIYPLPNDEFDIDYFSVNPVFGVTTQIENVSTSDFGVLANIGVAPGEQVRFSSPFGVVGDVFDASQLNIRYIRDPRKVLVSSDQLELPPMFDTAIKHYVIGHAFMDDLDTQYQEKGLLSLRLYDAEAEQIGRRTQSRNATRADNHRTGYRGFV